MGIEPKVWYAAVTQSFFSLSVGFGSLTTYASFNKFRHPTSRDALIISFADTFTSLLAGTVIFAILGHMGHETGQEVEDVVKSSAGPAVISYPEVLASFPASNFFSVVFFLMLITLGLGSAIGLLSSVTTTLTDSFPTMDKKTIIKLCCAVGFAIGVFYVTPGGMLMLDMVDHYGGTMLILGLASLEIIGIAWVYGTNIVTRDFNFMFETKLSVYWRFCWGILCPLLLPTLFTYLVFVDGGPFVKVNIAESSKQRQFAGTRWQASVFSSCRSIFSSPSPPTSRARGSWCAFGTPSGAVDLEESCARRSFQTTRGARAASRRGKSGRCTLRHTVSWNSCLPV